MSSSCKPQKIISFSCFTLISIFCNYCQNETRTSVVKPLARSCSIIRRVQLLLLPQLQGRWFSPLNTNLWCIELMSGRKLKVFLCYFFQLEKLINNHILPQQRNHNQSLAYMLLGKSELFMFSIEIIDLIYNQNKKIYELENLHKRTNICNL